MARVASVKKIIFYIVILLGLTLPEVLARVYEYWRPFPPIDFYGGFEEENGVFRLADDGWLETAPPKRYNFAMQRFNKNKGSGTFRLILVGESSVRQLYPLHKKLEELIQKKIKNKKIEIINAGGNSWGSHRIFSIINEIISLNPDRVFIYMGHNEYEEVEQYTLLNQPWADFLTIAHHSALIRVLTNVAAKGRVQKLVKDHLARTVSAKPDVARAWIHKFSEKDIAIRASAFKENLSKILGKLRRANIAVSLGTVATNLRHPYLSGPDGKKFLEVEALIERGEPEKAIALSRDILKSAVGRHQASEIENSIIRELAKMYEVGLADVEGQITLYEPRHFPGEHLFSDHCHLNDRGNLILLQTFVSTI